MKARTIVATVSVLCAPFPCPAFESLEDISWPATGIFPAYPVEEPDKRNVRFSVFGGAMYDDNLFRLSDSVNPATIGVTDKSDTVVRAGGDFKADLPAGRQHFLLDGRVERRDYDKNSFLDHTPYRAGAAWKWLAGEDWRGDIGYRRQKRLASLAELQAPIKDLITSDWAYFSAGYSLSPRWRVRGGYDWSEYEHSATVRRSLDNETSVVTGGIDYVTPAGSSVGAQVKYTDGRYPNREFVAGSLVDNSYEETEASAVTRWVVTGKSVLKGRIGYTNRQHDQVPQRDFEGWTGRGDLDWFVGAKTLVALAAWREIQSTEDVSASFVLSKGWSVGPRWAPTEKFVFQARYVREDRDYRGDPRFVVTGLPEREDTFRGLLVSAGYAPLRSTELAIAVETGERDSNIPLRDYDDTTVSVNARFRF
ncbi:MAG TPA: XrtB/PEP-CTERM-associated polysaccharide biosynthesis outer membrane protein EpsL [Burkholderiales bacterium]|jgi:exopolysaccharide biosynthesis operon protein EpsL|nr:XrtB/PEP-CTERM-associated polysaccharide biosynthesis outer membrane protein EpsL [Burkholderiales bacterium]